MVINAPDLIMLVAPSAPVIIGNFRFIHSKAISDVNLYLAIGLLLLAFLVGPTIKIINSLTNGLGAYIGTFIQDSLHIEAFSNNTWLNAWRIFYWAWWIAWAPFVGTFIARISRGRTIREFVLGVIIAPSIASFIWFAVFGAMGINLGITGKLGIDALKSIAASPETAFFVIMGHYKLGAILSIIAVFLLGTFFITSANSATFVLGMLTSDGDLNPSNSKKATIAWRSAQLKPKVFRGAPCPPAQCSPAMSPSRPSP
jgi:glycine betaine transporter